ncbi:MAG: ImmA/IrrE family metallo-endopeptidase [Rhodospirillaceae bacterium]|nr:ImmA/IrrE family metallo-endopeptidase [Rhodospirillaceae bacterium]
MSAKEWSRIDAEQVEIVYRFLDEYPVKLGAMARELGIIVKLSTLKPGISGHIRREENGQYVIRINRHESRERQRYTLAHEISHFLLHRSEIDRLGEIEDNVLYRSGASEQKEYEANRLAADLVMPHNVVRSKLEECGPLASEEVIDFMAEVFQVSKAAMEVRLSTIS